MRWSSASILLQTASHVKNPTFVGTQGFRTTIMGKDSLPPLCRDV